MGKAPGPVESATRVELADMGVAIAGDALAEAALLLARRLDEGVPAYATGSLTRELRHALADVRARRPVTDTELERFLRGVADPGLSSPGTF